MSARCTLVVPDAGPLNSLWVADALKLLLELAMPIVVLDAIYDELTSDPVRYIKDRDVKAFIDSHTGADIEIATTSVGAKAREARAKGQFLPGRGVGDAAIAEFIGEHVERYMATDRTVLLLFEDADFRTDRLFRRPEKVHMLSTIGLLRGLEEAGVITSAKAVTDAMENPPDPERWRYRRALKDAPAGTDLPAPHGSTWRP